MFADPEELTALNNIVHPAVSDEMTALLHRLERTVRDLGNAVATLPSADGLQHAVGQALRAELAHHPAPPSEPVEPSEFHEPDPGHRFVGVWFSLRNVGRTRYASSPSNGAQLVDTRGRIYDTTILVDGRCESPGTVRIPAGQKRLVCLAFEVPDGARLRYFEFTLNSGFADETGQWTGLGDA